MFELDNGNKCGKCQNHDFEVLKKGAYLGSSKKYQLIIKICVG